MSTPFSLLDDAKSKVFLAVFCGIFSIFFIIYFNPFDIKNISYDTALGSYLSIWSVGVIGTFIISFTQFCLRPLAGMTKFTTGQFLLWIVLDFLCVTIVVFILFGEASTPFFEELWFIVEYTISLAILPYILACLLIAVAKLSATLSEREVKLTTHAQYAFKDDSDKVQLTIHPDQIILIKSENNYASIFYHQNDQVERKLIRTTLKKLENELTFPNLI